MDLKELKELNGSILNNLEICNILEDSNVKDYVNCGSSGLYPDCTWYSVVLIDETEINVYNNKKEDENNE